MAFGDRLSQSAFPLQHELLGAEVGVLYVVALLTVAAGARSLVEDLAVRRFLDGPPGARGTGCGAGTGAGTEGSVPV